MYTHMYNSSAFTPAAACRAAWETSGGTPPWPPGGVSD